MMFKLPDLPYDYAALEPHIDAETLRIHHDKHHATYVKNLNDALVSQDDLLSLDIDELVANLSRVPENIRTKVRNNGGGHANHTLFWQILTSQGRKEPTGGLMKQIQENFGNFTSFQDKFTTAALGRFGSGWAWVVSEGGKLALIDTPNQDTPRMDNKVPILGLDIWEHAYYLKYQNRRADYIKAWWNVVNWDEVTRRWNEEKAA